MEKNTRHRPRLIRITTVPISLQLLLRGQFRYMIDQGYDVHTISADGSEVAEVLKEGVTHTAIPFTRKITPLHDLRCLYHLVKVIKKIQPDIIHTHTPKAGLLGMLAGWISGAPVRMHTVAGLPLMEATGLKRSMLEVTEKITYACAHRIYPNSRGLQTFIETQLKTSPARLKIIGSGSSNGIDTFFFTRTPALEAEARNIRTQYGITDNDTVFSFVGRVVKDKGIVELTEAFRTISANVDQPHNPIATPGRVFLMIVGPFEQELDPLPTEVVTFLHEDKQVIMTGFQHDVRPWLMASDIFVFPSYREGFPNVVMQASLLKVPCIVSDINGCNEIITHNSTGLIVPPKNIAALTEAMQELLVNKESRTRFSTNAHEYISNNFDRQHIWQALEEEYREMMIVKGVR